MNLKNKNVTVIGLGKSGISAAKLLWSKGANVKVTDYNDNSEVISRKRELKSLGIDVETGKHSEKYLNDIDLLVVSPGVPENSYPITYARKKGILTIGEIELGYMFCTLPIIGVSGTNGKTTVTNMINDFLNKSGIKSIACGNIGLPFTDVVLKDLKDFMVVLELSSFQLENIISFHPFIGILLDIDEDHMDRYKDINAYKSAKYKMFKNQNSADYSIIINPDYSFINKKSKMISLDRKNRLSADIFFYREYNFIYDEILYDETIDTNKKVVLIVLALLGKDIKDYIDGVLNYKNLEHRLEFVSKIKDISFINDSKSTNISSAIWALEKYDKVVLIAGGRNKNLNFENFPKYLKKKIRSLIVFGECKQEIKKSFENFVSVYITDTIEEAVVKSFRVAKPGDNVLFSPMCSSFDMFKDYKHRGEKFKEQVFKLQEMIKK